MEKLIFKILLEQAIYDYKQSTEDDERSNIIQKLIDDLENPDQI